MTDGLQPFVCGDAEKLSETLGSMLPQSKSDSDIRMLRGRVKLWLRETVMLMVDNPGSVRVTDGNTEANVLQIRLEVHPEDVGKVIGKGGQNARALRTMLLAIGHTQRHHFMLDIVETDRRKTSQEN